MIGTVDNPDLAGKVIQGFWFANERLQKVGMQVLDKAGFKCYSCGFVSRTSKKIPHGYMVPIDIQHPGLAALQLKDAKCMCPLCASALAVNWSVVEHPALKGELTPLAGSLIWLPEIEQSKLSLIASYIAVSTHCLDVAHPLAEALNHADISFRGRRAHLASNIPLYKEDCDSDFSRALALLPNEFHSARDEIMSGVRFWPNSSFWVSQAKYWFQATYLPLEKANNFFDEV
ncbi:MULTISPECIES: hypothetical protein [Pseudomonas]|uniref:hypothetical protein n=1 Tax=Pseudomonas TaxID=286 RepID=UPI001472E1C4|nr:MULTISPECIES: hypothetical protein [Pseudomonas]MEC4242117.1 hypothetical protein [Pseudomonas sp. DSV-1]NNB34037.1 hypothetical protein [Pseudomonas fragi]